MTFFKYRSSFIHYFDRLGSLLPYNSYYYLLIHYLTYVIHFCAFILFCFLVIVRESRTYFRQRNRGVVLQREPLGRLRPCHDALVPVVPARPLAAVVLSPQNHGHGHPRPPPTPQRKRQATSTSRNNSRSNGRSNGRSITRSRRSITRIASASIGSRIVDFAYTCIRNSPVSPPKLSQPH